MINEIHRLITEDSNNSVCVDCGDNIMDHWASLNNAVFICINCSGVHRGFGTNISFIRSVNLDSWLVKKD